MRIGTGARRGKLREPWTGNDVVRWAPRAIVGVVLIGIGWFQAGGEPEVGNQVRWITVSVLGLLVLFYANALLILQARRAVGQRWHRLSTDLPGRRLAVASVVPLIFVALPFGTRYHQEGCALATGRPVTTGTRVEQERAGRRPCGICEA